MNIKNKFLDYNSILRNNLLNVVKYALKQASDYGLSDGHHFYITFNTEYKNNIIPSYLLKEYPENMIIVLENEFWDLNVEDSYFIVSLKFKGKIEKLKIMMASISCFVDPSVSFKLNLNIENDKKNIIDKNTKKNQNNKNNQNNTLKKEILDDNIILFKPNKK